MDPINMVFSSVTSGAGTASASTAGGATAAGAKAAGEFAQLVDRLLAASREPAPADAPAANGFGAQPEAAAEPGAAATAGTPRQPAPAVVALTRASATQSAQEAKIALQAAGVTVDAVELVSMPVVAAEEVPARGASAAEVDQQSVPGQPALSQPAPVQPTPLQAPTPPGGGSQLPVAQMPRLEVPAPQAETQPLLVAQNLRMVINWPPSGQQAVNGGQPPAAPDHLTMAEAPLLLIDASQNPPGLGIVAQSAATNLAAPAAKAPADADSGEASATPAQPVQAATVQPAPATPAETTGQQGPAATLPPASLPTAPVEATPHTATAPPAEAARTAAPAPALHRQLFAPIATLAATPQGERTLSVKVSPDSLGPITVTAQLGGEGLRVDLTASTDAGRDALRAMLPELRRELAATGHASLSVNTANADGSQQGSDTSRQGFGERPAPRPPSAPLAGATASPSGHDPRTRPVPGNPSGLDVMA